MSNMEVRWGTLDQLRKLYPVGKTKAYALLNEGSLRAKRWGTRTVWDLKSAEEYFESLPDYDRAA